MEHRRRLRGDCRACQGLCCVSEGFERSEWFAFDKPPGVPCPELERAFTCSIHERLHEGQGGCASYDCYGAGQRVCRELFPGASWRGEPALAAAMFRCFRALRALHELAWLLHEAGRLPLGPEHTEQRSRLLSALEPSSGFDPPSLAALDLSALSAEARRFLRELQVYLPPEPARRHLRLF